MPGFPDKFMPFMNQLSAILDTAGALVVVLDEEGRIIRFNRACEQLPGYAFGDVYGRPMWDLFLVPEEVGQFKILFQQICNNMTRTEYENCWVASDGSTRTIAWSAARLPGAKQTPTYIIATGIDVTERRRAQAKFQGLLEAAPDTMVVINQQGNIVLVNAQVEKMFGYCRQELLGEKIEKLVPERLRGKHGGHRRNFLAEPRSYQAHTKRRSWHCVMLASSCSMRLNGL